MEPPRTAPSFGSLMTWVTGLRVAGLPLQFLVFLLVARVYPLDQVGVYAVANAIWQAFKGFGPLGLDIACMRFVPILLAGEQAAEAQALERASQRLVMIVNVVAAIVLTIGSRWLLPGGLSGDAVTCGIVAAGIPIFALLGLQVAQLRARNLVKAAQFPESILLNALTGALIAGGAAFGPTSIRWALTATAVSALVVAAINGARFRLLHDRSAAPLDPVLRRSVARAAIPMFAGQSLATSSARVGPIVISALVGTSAAGLFEAAARLGQIASVSTWAAGVAAGPQMASSHAAGDRERLHHLVAVSSWIAFLPALAVFLVIVCAAKFLLLMFGGEFVAAYPAAVLVSLATAINAAGGLSATALYMTGRERVVLYLSMAGVLILVVTLFVLVPIVGIVGAGVAYCLAATVRDGGASALLYRELRIAPGVFSYAGPKAFAGTVRRKLGGVIRRKG